MPQFKDLDKFLDDTLELPVGGKVYTILPVDGKLGLRLQKLMEVGVAAATGRDSTEAEDAVTEEVLSDAEELDLYPQVLGDAYQELLDDGLSFNKIRFIATTAMFWNTYGEELAQEYWQAGGKAPAPNRAQRRAKTTHTGGGSTTRKPASGTGTNTRAKKSGNAPKAAG